MLKASKTIRYPAGCSLMRVAYWVQEIELRKQAGRQRQGRRSTETVGANRLTYTFTYMSPPLPRDKFLCGPSSISLYVIWTLLWEVKRLLYLETSERNVKEGARAAPSRAYFNDFYLLIFFFKVSKCRSSAAVT